MLATVLKSDESQRLLMAIDTMRETLREEKIALPEIVVVGDQSVLPRAQEICTRCPLELRMKSTTGQEYATIRGKEINETKITNFNLIAEEVTRLTKLIAGTGTNVSSEPIYLTVHKRDVPDLTLIDLPGITRNPLKDQPKDIHLQILNLIKTYIEPETAIVLHVIPASVDFTTSESMKVAKEYDPKCRRQAIAVSKIDKYDKGIDSKLQGHGPGSMKLDLGCVAVLNRSPEEIEQNVSFGVMRQREKQFFLDHPDAFQNVPEECKGSEQLVKKLAHIQQERILSTAPKIIRDLKQQIKAMKDKLKAMPVAVTSEAECWIKFNELIKEYRECIRSKVNGDYQNESAIPMMMEDASEDERLEETDDEEICQVSSPIVDFQSPAVSRKTDDRIAYQVYQCQRNFQKAVRDCFSNFFSQSYYKKVLAMLDEAAGVALPNFPSFQVIERLYRLEYEKLPYICHKLISDITEYLKTVLLWLFNETFEKATNYPRLVQRLRDVVEKEIEAAQHLCSEHVERQLKMERRVFTLNHYYMDTVNKQKAKKVKKDNEAASAAAST
ncbi:unnamed protein product, partial [Didymodactylos carnosus]